MINFISAENGMIQMFAGNKINQMVAEACTAKSICNFVQEHGLAEEAMMSSSMEFASEYGFESDGHAIELWHSAMKMLERIEMQQFFKKGVDIVVGPAIIVSDLND